MSVQEKLLAIIAFFSDHFLETNYLDYALDVMNFLQRVKIYLKGQDQNDPKVRELLKLLDASEESE